jgi:hypothetical protein
MTHGVIYSSNKLKMNVSNCQFDGLYSSDVNDFPLVFYTKGLYNIEVVFESCNFTNLTRMFFIFVNIPINFTGENAGSYGGVVHFEHDFEDITIFVNNCLFSSLDMNESIGGAIQLKGSLFANITIQTCGFVNITV